MVIMEILKKYEKQIHTILCVFSIIVLLFFPFVELDYGYDIESTYTGFTMAMNTYIGYFLFLLPVALVLAHYVPKYAAKKPLFSVVVPILCIAAWLLTVLFSKTFNSQFSDATLASGAWLSLISYILLGVYGVVMYKDVIVELINYIKNNSQK